MESKQCSVCEEIKPLNEFYSQKKKRKNGEEYIYYNPECKDCTKKRSTKWIKNNPERYQEIRQLTEEKPRTKLLRRQMDEKLRKEGKRKKWQQENKNKISEYNKNKLVNRTHDISDEEWESCKNYFNYRCAYCDLLIEEHFIVYAGKLKWTDFHQEHVEDKGANDLSNCIPSCKSCNSKKNEFSLEEWYREDNVLCEVYSGERLDKIYKWLNEDYLKYKE
jgi:hypothetical protein